MSADVQMIYIYFGSKMKDRRTALGLTLQEVSKLVGFSLSWCQKIEQGEGMANLEKLMKICEVLQCKPNDLLC